MTIMQLLTPIARSCVLACVIAGSAHADDRVVPCRPTITCTADLAAPGTLELEAGYQLRHVSEGDLQHGTPVLAKLPVAAWLELQLGSNGYTHTDTASYVDDVIAGAKVHLVDQTLRWPSLAITASASIPTVAQRGYLRTHDLAIVGHASKDAGSLHLDLNAGLSVEQLGGPRAYQPWTALAVTYAATAQIGLAIEPHYFADASPRASRDAGVIAAVEVTMRDWLVVDAAIDVVGWSQRSVTAIVGVSVAPTRLWGTP